MLKITFLFKLLKKHLIFLFIYDSISFAVYGVLAQLVAHHTGSVGVRGSNPLSSTKRHCFCNVSFCFA